MHIVMIAAENGALRGGKVGGIGDVIRDVPLALARQGHQVSVITPGYQQLANINDSRYLGQVQTVFSTRPHTLQLYRVLAQQPPPAQLDALINHYVLEHEAFAVGGVGAIYCHDDDAPFASDAQKFALFCTAVCDWLISDELHRPDVIHLHDWHAGLVSVLRRFHPRYRSLQSIHSVYTIHNLSLQGIRPLYGSYSSLQHWHPELVEPTLWQEEPDLTLLVDPRYANCINLMRCGLRLSDRVHAVSPSYCEEIQHASDPDRGFIGGEGLELDLAMLASQKRLVGILNGCEYPEIDNQNDRQSVLQCIHDQLQRWPAERPDLAGCYRLAAQRINLWQNQIEKKTSLTLLSLGRLSEQKVSLLTEITEDNKHTALDEILRIVHDGVYILMGTGDPRLERFFTDAMLRHANFLFLPGFSEELASRLYAAVDVLLMPSSYEPCGISQMLALRAGTPCIVHHVGGLRDTVTPGFNGFAFRGDSVPQQLNNMLDCIQQTCELKTTDAAAWQQLCSNARDTRFPWEESIAQYLEQLYR